MSQRRWRRPRAGRAGRGRPARRSGPPPIERLLASAQPRNRRRPCLLRRGPQRTPAGRNLLSRTNLLLLHQLEVWSLAGMSKVQHSVVFFACGCLTVVYAKHAKHEPVHGGSAKSHNTALVAVLCVSIICAALYASDETPSLCLTAEETEQAPPPKRRPGRKPKAVHGSAPAAPAAPTEAAAVASAAALGASAAASAPAAVGLGNTAAEPPGVRSRSGRIRVPRSAAVLANQRLADAAAHHEM